MHVSIIMICRSTSSSWINECLAPRGIVWTLLPETFKGMGNCVCASNTCLSSHWADKGDFVLIARSSTVTHSHKHIVFIYNMLRPWIPRLYLKMSADLRAKCSSTGVTVKKVDPKTGKKTVSLPEFGGCLKDMWLITYALFLKYKHEYDMHTYMYAIPKYQETNSSDLKLAPHGCLNQMRSGGKRLKETEQYPAGFGRALALRHAFGKDRNFLTHVHLDVPVPRQIYRRVGVRM